MNSMSRPRPTPRYQWGKPPEEQEFYERPQKPFCLNEMLLEFPDPAAVPRPSGYGPTAKQENTVAYLQARHKEQRYRLLNRHEEEYKRFKAEIERCIDAESFQLDYNPLRLATGMCQESLQLINSPAAKQAIDRLPASKRTVLISMEQLKPSPPGNLSNAQQMGRREVTSQEFAAKMAKMAVNERRRMLNEEEEMRMFQFESLNLFYEAMMRNNPEKYPKTSNKGPTKQTESAVPIPGNTITGSQNPVSFAMKPAQGISTVTGYRGPPIFAKEPAGASKDPRLAPQDPRLQRH